MPIKLLSAGALAFAPGLYSSLFGWCVNLYILATNNKDPLYF